MAFNSHDQVENKIINPFSRYLLLFVMAFGYQGLSAQTDIQITSKTVNDNTPNELQNITYTVTIRNNGPQATTALSILDLLPSTLTFVSATPQQGTYDGGTGIWNVGALASGTNRTLSIVAHPKAGTSGTTIINTVSYLSSTPTDNNPANNTQSVNVTVNTADIAITKSVNDNTPNEGQNVTFSIVTENNGPSYATNVVIKDTLPAGLTFGAFTSIPAGTTASISAGIITWTIVTGTNQFAPGTRTLQFTSSPITGTSGTMITNRASVFSSDQADPVPGNNTGSVTVTVNFPDIEILKTVTNGPYNENVNLTYTISVKNIGPVSATNVVVSDLLASLLSYVSHNATQGTYIPATGVWTIGTLGVNVTRTLTITCFPDAGSSGIDINNTASLTSMDQIDLLTSNNVDNVEITVAEVDLLMEKTVNDNTPSVGQTITFSLKLTNNGPGIATNLLMRDILPAGLSFVAFTSIPAGTVATHNLDTITWTDPTMNSGTNQTLQFTATVDAGFGAVTITNTASVVDFSQSDPNLANNTSLLTFTVNGADLAITKAINNPAPSEGGTIIYTITVTNHGPLAGNDVQISDVLPAGITYVSHVVNEGTYSPVTGIWGAGNTLDLNVAETRTLSITATVNAGTNGSLITNSAAITGQTQPDGITSNNSASVFFVVGNTDISLVKAVNGTVFNILDTVTYTLTLTNNGPVQSAGFSVNDDFPATLTYVSSSATLGSYNPGTGLWTFGTNTLPVNGTATLTIKAKVNTGTAGFSIQNTGYAIAVQGGNSTTNDTSMVTFAVHGADIKVIKTASASTPIEGDPLSYSITVTNNGPDVTNSLVIKDVLPSNLTYVSSSGGTYNHVNGEWNIGTLNAGSSLVLTINTIIDIGGGTTNSAFVFSSSAPDDVITNNSSSIFVSALKHFDAGACIIDLGVIPQTYNSGLRPYGLVYQLVKTYQVPVYWAINPGKSFVDPAVKTDQADFTVAGKTYYGSAFIISAEFVPQVQTLMDSWLSLYPGLTIDCNRPAFNAPIHDIITSFPNAVLDEQNGDKAITAFYSPSGVPAASYRGDGAPSNLNICDDLYVMPHADPQDWVTLEKETLDDFVHNGGWLFMACHSVSALETLVDLNGDGIGDLNYLSNAGLIEWGDHSDGTIPPPYYYSTGAGQYAASVASDPFMQFLGRFDGALQNGSEQINIPKSAGWRSTTTIAVWDHDHPEVVSGLYPPGPAAALAYGRAFGNPLYGMIMEFTSHTFNGGTIAENTAAGRTYGNFLLQAGLEFKPDIVINTSPDTMYSVETSSLSATATARTPPITYEWTSSCGGTFTSSTSAATDFTAPIVDDTTLCFLRLTVTDACGRSNFQAIPLRILPKADLQIVKSGSTAVGQLQTISYTITLTNNGPSQAKNTYVLDTIPDGISNITYQIDGGSAFAWPASDSIFTGNISNNQSVIISIFGIIDIDLCEDINNTAFGYSTTYDPDSTNNVDGHFTTILDVISPSINCPDNLIIECPASSNPAHTGSATALDNCDPSPLISYTDVVTAGSCSQEYSISRTWTALDDEGNISSCTQTIDVQDNNSPMVSGTIPTSNLEGCNASAAPIAANTVAALEALGLMIQDACTPDGNLTVTHNDALNGSCPLIITRTYTITDPCGNNTTAVHTIIVDDTLPPAITGTIAETTVEGCNASAAPAPVSTVAQLEMLGLSIGDDCTGDIAIVVSSNDIQGGTCPIIITRTYTITDVCGNNALVIHTINIDDTTAPTITGMILPTTVEGCDITAAPLAAASIPAIEAIGVMISDGCTADANLVVTHTDNANGTCPTVITRTYTITDACGNSATTIHTITLVDSTPPEIVGTLPPSTVEGCDITAAPAPATSVAELEARGLSISDACTSDANLIVTFSDDVIGTCPITITRTYTITDACGNSASVNHMITIDDTTAPTITGSISPTTIEGCDVSVAPVPATTVAQLEFLGLSINDICTPDASLLVSSVDIPIGTCPIEITRTYTIMDACGNSSMTIHTINIEDTMPPVISSLPDPTLINCPSTPIFTEASAMDACDISVTLSFVDSTTPGSCAQEYTATRTWTATDDCGNIASASQMINVVDNADPVITLCPPNLTIECSGSTLPSNTGTLTATDNCDGAPIITYTDVTSSGGCPQGYTITRTWTATDNCGNFSSCSQLIIVNGTPVATVDYYTTNEDTPILSSTVSGNDIPSEDGGNVYNNVCMVCTTTPNGTLTFNPDGTFDYTPNPNFHGTDNFIYQLCDVNGDCDTSIVYIIIDPADDMPVANDDTNSTMEDTPIVGAATAGNDMPSGDGGNVWSLIGVDGGAADGTVTMNADGTYTYTPDANFNGIDVFTYQICDIDGDCETATVTITITPVDDMPVANNDSNSTMEDTPIVGAATAGNDMPSGDGGNVWSLVGVDGGAANGTVTMNPDGTYTYTPDANFNGTDVFTYQICDIDGDCESATVTISIDPVNDIPVANPDVVMIMEDMATVIGTGLNDVDGDDPHLISITEVPANGTATIHDNGTPDDLGDDYILYTPDEDFFGMDTLIYQVCDVDNECDTALVVITITAVNDLPLAHVDVAMTAEDTPVNIASGANDTDGDDPQVIMISESPNHGMAVISNNGTPNDLSDDYIVYTPDLNFFGMDTLVYEVCDVDNECDTALVVITITPVNDPPVSMDNLSLENIGGSTVNIVVLGNDIDSENNIDPTTVNLDPTSVPGGIGTDTDMDGDTDEVIVPGQGTWSVDPVTGVVSFEPLVTFTGNPSPIQYSVEDTEGASGNEALITITYCTNIQVKVFLEGPYDEPSGLMTTDLNLFHLLPGQDPALSTDPLAQVLGVPTPVGQPYVGQPWNYLGSEGDTYGDPPTNAGSIQYPETVTDWVLVSIRTNDFDPTTKVWECAGLLHNDGVVEFPEDCPCLAVVSGTPYYIVVQHRNHLAVMSYDTVPVGNVLGCDFTTLDSWKLDIGSPQEVTQKLIGGVYTMYAANGEQIATQTDIISPDNAIWLIHNSQIFTYLAGDHNLNADVNSFDRALWLQNVSLFNLIQH